MATMFLISMLPFLHIANSQAICDTDISPNSEDTCLQFYEWQLCAETWMTDKCCLTCGYASCLDSCYAGDINNVPTERLTPYNCSSDISPNQDTCQQIQSWSLCKESWVFGHCCKSCPESCNCPINNNNASSSTLPATTLYTTSEMSTSDTITTDTSLSTIITTTDIQSQSICNTDISSDPDNTCLDFYEWGLCAESWMTDKCCITCGYTSCLDRCYDGDINNVPPDRLTPYDCSSDISPNTDDTCADFKSWGLCAESWMFGHCCSSCPEQCNCPILLTTTELSNTETSISETINIHHDVNCIQDIPPPPGDDGLQSSCLEQYRWDNCDKSWMKGYCCLTCGYESCLNECYDGDEDTIPITQYYPNPYNCSSNIPPPPGDDEKQSNCIQQAAWDTCDEWWMNGYCCLSCPEACMCDEFDYWGNLTIKIKENMDDGKRGNIVNNEGWYEKLSYEEIQYWERTYISLHCVLLLFILIIPIVMYVHNYCRRTYMENINNMKEDTQRNQKATMSPTIDEMSTGNENNSVRMTLTKEDEHSPDPTKKVRTFPMSTQGDIAENEEVNNQTQVNAMNIDKNRSLTTSYNTKSNTHKIIRSRSVGTKTISATKQKRKQRNDVQQESKEAKMFKLLAFICVFLWTLRIVLEIIAMLIWYNDDDGDLAAKIAKPWDSFRMLIYIIPKTLMYFSFIARIYVSFKDSAYRYPKSFIIGLMIVLFIDFGIRITIHIYTIFEYSGNIVDRDTLWNAKDEILFYGLMFLVIEEIMFILILVIAFIRPLFVISKHMLTQNMLDMMSKYIVLGLWCILSSGIISIFQIFYINADDLFIIWTTSLMKSLDCVINAWCTILMFNFAMSWYMVICSLCHRGIKFIYIKKFRSQGIELTKI